jgi:shikimate dehydrogenase
MTSGETTLAAVIGSPVRHSLSPTIHNAAFATLGLDWLYVAFEVEPGDAAGAVAAMRTLGLGGMSVTMPHKVDVIDGLDRLDPAAERLGAVNCIAWDDHELVGHNTDGAGFVDGLVDDLGLSPLGHSFGVIGAGGAARAVIAALGQAGADEVVVVNRSAERAAVAASLAGEVGRVAAAEALGEVDVIVNATPVGMGDGKLPLDPAFLDRQAVVDLVYEPRETPLLRAARDRGLEATNGVSMLVHLSAHSFRLWTGRDAPLAAMREAIVPKKG